ncbi:hypothetical protein LARI1_G001539 [Lachnellula arida]|uniref:Heterokaryon incompatibility domain-containing protein n=1 Tax=Lachnellula arida TaxID=1316785 RepID=A0A8T9BLJ8_9HELO|nr:hypothetical protein LARI1_G001539 [Lachnellula arida]
MEFNLLPTFRGNGNTPFPRTRYVANERWDGSTWVSYPVKKGKSNYLINAESFDLMDYYRAERGNPTPVREQESFLQTWLYFGLICQFIGANAVDGGPPTSQSKGIIDRVYDLIALQDDSGPFVRLDEDGLNSLRDIGLSLLSKEPEARKAHLDRMIVCLSCTQAILEGLPRDFNYMVKYSIASLGELYTQTVNVGLEHLQLPKTFSRMWSGGLLDADAKASMMEHGWCPSDIARAEVKYSSIQALYMMRMLGKCLPPRDHSRCTDDACNIYQIDPGNYQQTHQDCSCHELVVRDADLTSVLSKDEKFPILKFKGDMHNLDYDIVESGAYIAISHVWADGLGNPNANSLHRCQLSRLQETVKAVVKKDSENVAESEEHPLIWLDTLCCPAQDGPGKRIAIEKIRLVYQRAKHVLVLDLGLMSYNSKSQDWLELLVRIFTSGWMRRLWTLQEGALAQSLYFQFADQAVSLQWLADQLLASVKKSMRHLAIFPDLSREFLSLSSFFLPSASTPAGDNPALNTLDYALNFRSVSVATDEPLCIGTLMSLDLHEILQIDPKEKRMQKVWELIAAKKGGIPAELIFLDNKRIDADGWRWAPKTLLQVEIGMQKRATRMVHWQGSQIGKIDARGLRVEYPGYRLTRAQHGDQRPPNPWPGIPRVPEMWLQFRDVATMRWYRITDSHLGVLSLSWTTDEQRRENNEAGLFPLQDLADTGKAVLVMNSNSKERINKSVLATIRTDEGAIRVKTERHVMVSLLSEEEGYIYDVIGSLALRLRGDELTDQHLKIYKDLEELSEGRNDTLAEQMAGNQAFQHSLKALSEQMKNMVREVVQSDERFHAAIKTYWGESFAEDLWVLIKDFFSHNIQGQELEKEQVWFID